MSQDMQIVDDGASTQIEEIFAHALIASTSALPPANMGKGMLNCHPFTQFGSSLWRLLTLAQLDEQGFIGVDADAASLEAGGTLGLQGALGTGLFGKVNHTAGYKRHLLRSRTPDGLPFPIQSKRLLVKAFADPNRPSFAIHLQPIAPLPHQMTA
jgi:hypothetical protein